MLEGHIMKENETVYFKLSRRVRKQIVSLHRRSRVIPPEPHFCCVDCSVTFRSNLHPMAKEGLSGRRSH